MYKSILIICATVGVVLLAVFFVMFLPYQTTHTQQTVAIQVQPSGNATTACGALTSGIVNSVIGDATNEASDEGQPTDEIIQSQCVYVQDTSNPANAESLQLMITTATTGSGRQQLRADLQPLAGFEATGRPDGSQVVRILNLGDEAYWDEKFQQVVVLTKDSQYKVTLRLMQPKPTDDYSMLERAARQTVANLKP